MATKTLTHWKPGMELPYIVPFGQGRMLAITLKAAWLKPDRTGQPLLLPPAVRALDRLRAVFTAQENLTPGFIIALREATGLTQEQFGRKLGVTKMTVSRWECGRIVPSSLKSAAIRNLQSRVQHDGVKIDGEKRSHGPHRTRHSAKLWRSHVA
jgi:DNA-binding transcriptional regulator YiaG